MASAAATTSSATATVPGLDMGLGGKLVLVTGSSKGIGKAIAGHFLKVGAVVIVNGRSQASVDKCIEELTKEVGVTSPAALHGVVGDLSTKEGADAVIKGVDAIGDLHVLVNNAGIFSAKKFEEVDDETWLHYFQVNVMSMVRLSRHYLPKFLESNNHQRIINIGSETGNRPIADMIHYSTTKATVHCLSRGLAELTKGKNVTANSLAVGPTKTEGVVDFLADLASQKGSTLEETEKNYFVEREPTSLIARFLSTDEIAHTTVFLASRLASGINGSCMRAEGGIIRSV